MHLVDSLEGCGTLSRFGLSVARKERLLRKGVLIYLGSASEFTGTKE